MALRSRSTQHTYRHSNCSTRRLPPRSSCCWYCCYYCYFHSRPRSARRAPRGQGTFVPSLVFDPPLLLLLIGALIRGRPVRVKRGGRRTGRPEHRNHTHWLSPGVLETVHGVSR